MTPPCTCGRWANKECTLCWRWKFDRRFRRQCEKLGVLPAHVIEDRFVEKARASGSVKWAVGITTVPQRRKTYLPATLRSLRRAGFDSFRLFVDGEKESASWELEFDCHVTTRWPLVGLAGNWVLSLSELYWRHPEATFYALFQDDILCSANLREFLEKTPFPENAYLNLWTRVDYEPKAKGQVGWFETDLRGLGAMGLVFTGLGVFTLLSAAHLQSRPLTWNETEEAKMRWWRAIDGGVVDSMRKAGWKEHCHFPSLIQHVGQDRTIGKGGAHHFPTTEADTWQNPQRCFAPSWRGEDFDCLSLLP